jgi:hypothetical protein
VSLVAAAVLSAVALAGPYIGPASTSRAHSGEVIHLKAGATFHRIGTLNVRHAHDVTITFHVPQLAPGKYPRTSSTAGRVTRVAGAA